MLKIPYYQIEWLVNFLNSLETNAKGNRMRKVFNDEILKPHFMKFHHYITELIELHSEKDEDGIMKQTEEKHPDYPDKFKVIFKDRDLFITDYNDLAMENAVIKITEENEDVIVVVKKMFLECENKLSGQVADIYDEICLKLENLNI
ncbi:hypothetical protein [Paenibacillus taichungensis]